MIIAATFAKTDAADAAAEDLRLLLHVRPQYIGRGVLGAYQELNDGHALVSALVRSQDIVVAKAILTTHGGAIVAERAAARTAGRAT